MFAVVILLPSGMLRVLQTLADAYKNAESSVAQLLSPVKFAESALCLVSSTSDSFLNVRTCTWDVSEETVHAMSHWYRINANADNDQPDNVVRVCNTCRSTLMSCAAYSCTQTLPQEQRERGMYTSVADINSKISPS